MFPLCSTYILTVIGLIFDSTYASTVLDVCFDFVRPKSGASNVLDICFDCALPLFRLARLSTAMTQFNEK